MIAALAMMAVARAQPPLTPEQLKEEALIFTAPGFEWVGEAKWDGIPAWMSGTRTGQVQITVRDAETGQPTPCRVNVVGRDGNFYQPPPNRLSRYALTGVYTLSGIVAGNRRGKGPYRYLGRFFYTLGESMVRVPTGRVRVEVWKGFEYRPETVSLDVPPGTVQRVDLKLTRTAPMASAGYHSGDTHLHLPRESEDDEQMLFDLLACEDFHYGVDMAWNNPAGPYMGFMDKQVYPQRELGRKSINHRGNLHVVSGQEYRSTVYGHLNLVLRDDVALPGVDINADFWPVFGEVARETISRGGFALMAHAGYGQEIYADVALGNLSGVELLQFAEYRDMGLEGWYAMLNTGYRFAAHAASDFPGTRYLADSRTYAYHEAEPTMPEWLEAIAAGRSFFTTGPLLLLEVDGEKPGAQIRQRGDGPHTVTARVRMRCEVTPVTNVDLIVNGRVLKHLAVPRAEGQGRWVEFEQKIELGESAWIAARAYSKSPGGFPDAEAHTNPVYFYLNDRAPFVKSAVDHWITKLDGQIAIHAKRSFPENARVLGYFQKARDVLLKIRAQGGLSADQDPAKLAAEFDVSAPGMRNLAADGGLTHATDAEVKAFLKPVPATSPPQALKSFETVGGFEMQLVASEPLVRSPVAAAFDEDGNLFVAELTDYPFNPAGPTRVAWQRPQPTGAKPLGAVRLLRDIDGDGVFDRSTVFADGLLWVAGVAPWKGGVYVSAPPDIWYMKDTDGDGVADLRQKVFTGFGTNRQQSMLNSLQFGLDHQIYGTSNGNGGSIVLVANPTGPAVSVNGRDFSFAPETHTFEPHYGARGFGMTFDDWGNRFICDQVNPAFHVALELRYFARNPAFTPRTTFFTTTSSPTPMFRISPIERWRHIKSSRRFAGTDLPADIVPLVGSATLTTTGARQAATVPGVSHHVLDATSGVTIYRGAAYPEEYRGNIFSADSQGNLVHRRRLVPEGATFRTERADVNTEFVRSSDNWFRPVNFVNAPDGTLYCIDMAREHSESANLPPDIEKHMDLSSGRDRGRIYRIAPPGFRSPAPPRLSKASTAEIVRLLENPNGWWRDTAHRLLFERQDKSAIPTLEALASGGSSPLSRLHALWSLQGLNALRGEGVLVALNDRHPALRAHAIRLAESRLTKSPELQAKVAALTGDPDARVRLQVAYAVGECRQWDQASLLARLVRENAADPWIQAAAISSAKDCAGDLFATLTADKAVAGNGGGEFLPQLVETIGAQSQPAGHRRIAASLASAPDTVASMQLLAAFAGGLLRTRAPLPAIEPARPLLSRAGGIATDTTQPEPLRRAAIAVLAFMPSSEATPPLRSVLNANRSPAEQTAAIRVLQQFGDPQFGPALLERFNELAPAAQTAAIDALLERAEGIDALLAALESKSIAKSKLSAKQIAALRKEGDDRVRLRAVAFYGAGASGQRKEALQAMLPALQLAGSAPRGREIFQSRCALCHRHAGVGFEFGADLVRAASGGKEKLLSDIVEPECEVLPQNYVTHVETRKGETTTGIIRGETPAAITLFQVGGTSKTIPRDNIVRLRQQRVSLMPEGLENGLNRQDMADLLEFIVNSGARNSEARAR